MAVWFAIPSKREPLAAESCLSKWRAQGYRIALWRDQGDSPIPADLALSGKYRGYHHAVNALCREILKRDPEAQWIVTGGDDIDPEPTKRADVIASECTAHFWNSYECTYPPDRPKWGANAYFGGDASGKIGTFGVMQPTGDKWATPDHFCGSPWMGREFCRRMYGGNGPWCEAYYHMWGDLEMWEVATKLGVLWARPDLTHYHHHWQREKTPEPNFLKTANQCHPKLKQLFEERRAAGFPGHEPIP